MKPTFWTAERTQRLRITWGSGPTREVAELIGCTKNMVIGKARRLKLAPMRGPYKRRVATAPHEPPL